MRSPRGAARPPIPLECASSRPSVCARLVAPQRPEPAVAPAPLAVLVVADGVLPVEVLVVFLRRIEGPRGDDLRVDRLAQLLLDAGLRSLRFPSLLLVAVEDRR